MEKQAYELVGNSEDFLWFYKIRKEIIVDTIKNEIPNFNSKKLLDIGCGSGDILVSISKYIPNSFGLEPYEYSHQKYNNIIHQPIFNNNFEDNSFDIVTFFDVMEHIEDENKFLSEVKRLIKNSTEDDNDGGYILITVPAYQWLFCEMDVMYKHYRRYNIKSLKNVLLNNGFEIKKITYFNCLLSPGFIFVRLIDKLLKRKVSEQGRPGLLNNILLKIFSLEIKYLRKHTFPCGSSILCLCKYKK